MAEAACVAMGRSRQEVEAELDGVSANAGWYAAPDAAADTYTQTDAGVAPEAMAAARQAEPTPGAAGIGEAGNAAVMKAAEAAAPSHKPVPPPGPVPVTRAARPLTPGRRVTAAAQDPGP